MPPVFDWWFLTFRGDCMSEESLEQKIEKRKKEAEDKQIWYKCRLISEELANVKGENNIREHTTRQGELLITANASYSRAFNDEGYSRDAGWYFEDGFRILYKDELVFNGSGPSTTQLYIPGKWEKTLENLYSQAQEKVDKREQEKKQAEVDNKKRYGEELRKKWKL